MPSIATAFCLLVALPSAFGWASSQKQGRLAENVPSTTCLSMNMFTDLGSMLSGGKLVPQKDLPYGEPLARIESQVRTLAIAERGISFTGEDFDVYDVDLGQPYACVRGAMLHLPGKDKMRVQVEGNLAVTLDRKLVAVTPTYDIYRGNEVKVGWIEKAVVAFTDSFHIHLENDFHVGPFKPAPAFTIEGDFLDRRFVFKNRKGEVCAKVSKDGWVQFDQFNHYQAQVASGMDAALVIACTCAIDEEFDEEHAERAAS